MYLAMRFAAVAHLLSSGKLSGTEGVTPTLRRLALFRCHHLADFDELRQAEPSHNIRSRFTDATWWRIFQFVGFSATPPQRQLTPFQKRGFAACPAPQGASEWGWKMANWWKSVRATACASGLLVKIRRLVPVMLTWRNVSTRCRAPQITPREAYYDDAAPVSRLWGGAHNLLGAS